MNKKYDLTGMRFGTLAVTGFNGRDKDGHLQWNCLCDCGNRSVVNGTALRNGSVKACKRCGHLKDITNQRFGYLTAVNQTKFLHQTSQKQRLIRTKQFSSLQTASTPKHFLMKESVYCLNCHMRILHMIVLLFALIRPSGTHRWDRLGREVWA